MSDNIHVDINKFNTDNTKDSKEFISINGVSKDINDLSDIDIQYLLDNADIDDKGNKVLPDKVVYKYYKRLPDGTRDKSRSKIVMRGGLLNDLSNSMYRDITVKGAKALNAMKARRRTFRETISDMLTAPADSRQRDTLGLKQGATQQDAIIAAMILQAADGNRGAAEFVRDTVGEKPADISDVNLHSMTEADRSLLDKVKQRLDSEDEDEEPTAKERAKESGGEKETK